MDLADLVVKASALRTSAQSGDRLWPRRVLLLDPFPVCCEAGRHSLSILVIVLFPLFPFAAATFGWRCDSRRRGRLFLPCTPPRRLWHSSRTPHPPGL
jgi:hypothetical protein